MYFIHWCAYCKPCNVAGRQTNYESSFSLDAFKGHLAFVGTNVIGNQPTVAFVAAVFSFFRNFIFNLHNSAPLALSGEGTKGVFPRKKAVKMNVVYSIRIWNLRDQTLDLASSVLHLRFTIRKTDAFQPGGG